MKKNFILFSGCATICMLFFCMPSPADEKPQQISYSRHIEPIFRDHCQGCHQPAKALGDYVMTAHSGLLVAGESGEAGITPGQPEKSYLIDQITPDENGQAAMPKKGKALRPEQIELIRKWIEQGAEDDSVDNDRFDSENPPVYSRPPVITALAYSPDGKWIASSGFQEVLLIDTADWSVPKRLIGLSERIESLSFSPDSQRLVVTGGSPGRRGEIQVWDVDTGELLLSHQETFDTIRGGCFSPDGKLIAFGGADSVVRAIDSETGEQRLHQGAHEDWILACVFNPDGTHLLSAGRDMTVKLTEVSTERFVDNVTSITPGALRGGIHALAMHPERDEVLVGGADGIPKAYRIFRETERRIGDDANLIREFPSTKGRIFDVVLSRDGSQFAVASTLDGKSQLQVYPYDFEGKLPDNIKEIMKKRVADRKADERKLVDDYIHSTSPPSLSLEVSDSSIYSVAFSHDGKYLVAGGSDGLVRLVNLASGKVEHELLPVPLSTEEELSQAGAQSLLAGHGIPAAETDLPKPGKEAEAVPNVELVELNVQPASIQLQHFADYCQLVVTATFANGQTYDVSRISGFDDPSGNTSTNALGLVRPVKSGQGTLQVSFGGISQKVDIECSVANSDFIPDFVRDVNPVLSRLGCNAGTCHGAQKGKNGFKLSLRGYDPVEDIRALSDDLSARRLNPAAPDASLMLQKPVGLVPHEGGVLLRPDSVHYAVIRDWIANGAQLNSATAKVARLEIFPQQPVVEREGSWQQFRIVAHYPNGSSRDVTHEAFIESGNTEVCQSFEGGRVQALRRGEAPILVRYEGAYAAATITVMGDRQGFAWQPPESYSTIDRLVADKWQRMKILPSQLTDDSSFLRRVRLDLTGLPPTTTELKEFLGDNRPSRLKRQAKIDELIGSADFVEHWTNKWADLLQVNSKFLGTEGARAFRDWIRTSVSDNQPYDQFAKSVLTASGSNKEHPAASYYKILRDPDLMMENTTHLFLAVRFNCNKCHDHPFERWTQDQYYELAAYFAQTGLKEDPASEGKKIGGTAVEGAKPLYEEVYDRAQGEMTHVRTGNIVSPSFPFECDFEQASEATRREQLAAWITSKDNPYFARSYVNRLWGYLTGTGLMEPIDDIRAGNPPTNPELLEHLTREFIDNDFDVQHILRLICNSRTYQLSVASNDWNEDDQLNYSHAKARRLPAEVLYDAVYHVTGAVSAIPGVEPGTRAAALPDVAVQLPDGFLNNLGRPVRESACECERSQELQLGPIMALVSGPTIGKAISDPQCDLPKLAGDELTEEELIHEIFLRVLSRAPTDAEVSGVMAAAEQIALDHTELQAQLNERESWWKSKRVQLEEKRKQDLANTKQQIIDREELIAPEREKMEQARQEKLSGAKTELAAYEKTGAELANKYLAEQNNASNWFPLAPTSVSASNQDKLTVQQDRSIIASGKGNKGTYTIKFETPLTNITGFRLETLPLPSLTGGGPGLPSNGNFVVTEIEATAASSDTPKDSQKLKIVDAKADFTQSGFDPKQVIDGESRNQKGWAVSPRGGSVHWATFKFEKPITLGAKTVLEFKIHQYHNAGQHRLAHFRLSVTTDQGDLQLSLPEAFTALQSTKAKERTQEDLEPVFAYLQKSDEKWVKLQESVTEASKPLPADTELVGLRSQQKLLEIETPDDPKLVQLRKDFTASEGQLKNRRLTLAQDLTWALINSPAFLFNH